MQPPTTYPPTTHQRMTAEEYYALPEGPPYFQLIHGEVFMSPSPTTQHQRVSMRLSLLIGNYLNEHPIGEIFAAPLDVDLGFDNIYQPDLIFVSEERRSILVERIVGAPDLVVEILSPSTALLDRHDKKAVYASTGATELWLIDLRRRQVEVYHLPVDAETPAAVLTADSGQILRTALLPGLDISVDELLRV
jgi:Uma2 family endonuclease